MKRILLVISKITWDSQPIFMIDFLSFISHSSCKISLFKMRKYLKNLIRSREKNKFNTIFIINYLVVKKMSGRGIIKRV